VYFPIYSRGLLEINDLTQNARLSSNDPKLVLAPPLLVHPDNSKAFIIYCSLAVSFMSNI